MSIHLVTQPIPDHIAEACAWLSAAERYTGTPADQRLTQQLDAADALNTLCDVHPPYPPIDTTRPPAPFGEAAPAAIEALERALHDGGPPQQRLRVARALRILRQALP